MCGKKKNWNPSCGKVKSPCAVKFEESLVRRSLYTVESRAFVWWSCKLKTPSWGKSKDTLVWWKVKKMLCFKIKNIKLKKRKIQKNQKGKSKKLKKEKKEKGLFSVVLDKMCVFCLYPIPDSQQCIKRGSCRRPILFGLLVSFYRLLGLSPVCVMVQVWAWTYLCLLRLFILLSL